MAILKRILSSFAIFCVLICCINDAVQHSLISLLFDSLLAGGLIATLLSRRSFFLLKMGFFFGIISSVVFFATSIKSVLLFIPFLIVLFAFLIQYLYNLHNSRRYILCLIASLSVFCAVRSFWGHQIFSRFIPDKIAVLEQGKWGNALSYEDKLSITSQYSYNLLHDFIGANKIDSLHDISDYSELWIVTPTKPFTNEQIEQISNWVRRGGRLVIITDHTDLFGHTSAINPLLQRFGISAQKNVILDSSGDGGTFSSYFENFRGLSSNSFIGFGETWLHQSGYSERTDYSKRSFFSDNQISDEEIADCHSIGLRVNHGFGGVVLFGDSTLLANFALARPSAQAILRKLINGGGSFSCYGIAFFACLVCLLLYTKVSTKLKIIGQTFMAVLGVTCFSLAYTNKQLSLDKLQTIKVSGDWSLVEGKQGHLLTLFSAAYVSSPVFPIWEGISGSDRTVTIGNSVITEDDFGFPKKVQNVPFIQRITLSPSGNISNQLAECIATSGFSSFWFDEGVGLLREQAYKSFWLSLQGNDNRGCSLSVEEPTYVNMLIKMRGREPIEAEVPLMRIKEDSQWVVLGDWFVGKYISSDTILVRDIWQTTSNSVPDFYCRILPPSCKGK